MLGLNILGVLKWESINSKYYLIRKEGEGSLILSDMSEY